MATQVTLPTEHSYVRECDNKDCIVCGRVITVTQSGGIVTVPSKRLGRLSAKSLSKFQIKWDAAKMKDFVHANCWNVIKNSSLNRSEMLVVADAAETFELSCSFEELKLLTREVAVLLAKSTHTVCFTGAGVSVSSGLPTYRGTDGIDTISALCSSSSDDVECTRKRKIVDLTCDEEEEEEEEEEGVDYTALQPTLTHTNLAELHKMGKLDYCITQNCDGLHLKGGLPLCCMSDLHGNVFTEYCEKCGKEYRRDFCVDVFSTDCSNEPWYEKCSNCEWNHHTGRLCSKKKCKGRLRDTIVNFGDNLHENVCGGLPRATEMANRADLCLTLGTSLTVSPANSLPKAAKHLVIVNLQETDLDHMAHVRIWAKSDDFFQLLMPELASLATEVK